MAHLPVCLSVTLRLTFPQRPHPLTLHLSEQLCSCPGERMSLAAAAQVGACCPTGPAAGPLGEASPPESLIILPTAAAATWRDRNGPRRSAWRPGNQSIAALWPASAHLGKWGWPGTPRGQGSTTYAPLMPHQQVCPQHLEHARSQGLAESF